jgi:hypothetical protein
MATGRGSLADQVVVSADDRSVKVTIGDKDRTFKLVKHKTCGSCKLVTKDVWYEICCYIGQIAKNQVPEVKKKVLELLNKAGLLAFALSEVRI